MDDDKGAPDAGPARGSGGPSRSIASIAAAFRGQYTLYQYHFVEFIVAHMSDCSREFDGDLAEMLVMAVVGQVHLRACLRLDPDGMISPFKGEVDPGISASRLADVTGISRETVRRKLRKLEERGWIAQGKDHLWRLSSQRRDTESWKRLFELDRRGVDRAARLYYELRRIQLEP